MKRKLALLMSVIISASALCACGDPTQFSGREKLSNDYTRSTAPTENYNYNDGVTETPMTYNTYASSITNFELKMFRKYFGQQKDKTFVFSPISSTLQLGLMMNGASADTKDEISIVLGSDLTVENINQCSSYFKSRIEAVSKIGSSEADELSGKKPEEASEFIKLENNLFFNDTADVKSMFLQNNASFYNADIFRFMFSDENALTKVNRHFNDFTTENALSKLDEKQSLLSITASDICDKWLDQYTQADIKKGTFKSSDGDKTVNFMTSNEHYIKTDYAEGIIKYTSKNPLKLVLVMPKEGTSLEDYVADFTNLEYSNLLENMDITQRVTAKIPEFSIDSSKTAQPLSSVLTESGLYSLFTEKTTFGNISNSEDFMFNEMYEITPAFTLNASGISGTKSVETTLAKERVKELAETERTVEFNRPFIFLLIDNESNIPVYIGTVDNI